MSVLEYNEIKLSDGKKSLQHFFCNENSDLILTMASSNLNSIRFLGFVFILDTIENIFSTTALLIGVLRQSRAYVDSSINDACCKIPTQSSHFHLKFHLKKQ